MSGVFESANHRWVGGAMVTATLGLVMIATTGATTNARSARGCSNHTLHGEYGLVASGQRGVPFFLGGGIEKFVATAMTTFDGNGGFVLQGEGAGLHGEVAGTDPAINDILGSYEVNANCTGTIQWQPPAPVPPIVHSFVIVDNGREVRSAIMSPQPNVSIVEFIRQ